MDWRTAVKPIPPAESTADHCGPAPAGSARTRRARRFLSADDPTIDYAGSMAELTNVRPLQRGGASKLRALAHSPPSQISKTVLSTVYVGGAYRGA